MRVESGIHREKVSQAEQEAGATDHQAEREGYLNADEEASHTKLARFYADSVKFPYRLRAGGFPRREQSEKHGG